VTARRNRSLRGAIVGFGNVAVEGHLPAWGNDRQCSIVAVCDADESRLALAAGRLPQARRYTALDAMLDAERLDFVDVATPPASHAAIVLAVLARRIHVLCEKPLTIQVDDLAKIRRAAAGARAVVFTAHNWKYAPLFRTTKRALRRGDIGAVSELRLETIRVQPPRDADGAGAWRLDPAQAGGGILVDHGWHAFYLACHLLDADPVAVSAETAQRKFVATGVEDTAQCTVEFPGARAEIFLTWAGDLRRNGGHLTGAAGHIELADRTLIVSIRDRPPAETHFAQALSAGSYHPDWFAAMLDDFRAEIAEPGTRGANLREAEACARLIDACYRSSRAGGARVALHDAPGGAGGA